MFTLAIPAFAKSPVTVAFMRAISASAPADAAVRGWPSTFAVAKYTTTSI